jgi:hypothetical protein
VVGLLCTGGFFERRGDRLLLPGRRKPPRKGELVPEVGFRLL